MQWIRTHAILLAMCLPIALFFFISAIVPHERVDGPSGIDPMPFLWMNVIRVVAMACAIGLFAKTILNVFPLRVDHWGLLVGVIGGVIWIALCRWGIESQLTAALGFSESLLGQRSGLDPWQAYPEASSLYAFLGFRFALLVVCVPIAEELFLRGFFMRAVDQGEWEYLPLKSVGWTGLIAGTGYGVLTHPSEFFAAAVWFSLVTWLMVRTNRFWNCVLAHAVTNLILGLYIVWAGHWELW
ncbi:CAAX prenyl protease-related protein [Stieleria varia]|uniref:CAAX amino terminal protease self-immunity n=1 Tax=Stieleria varia TaxID=2528005 RepID=A0A5C5ZYN9_9BACT|nr:CAAX prenyl protease-related protein [Stieleria varia]TWT92744.1 CAAX amino terminal protease self- immunity [Stieleria varia]